MDNQSSEKLLNRLKNRLEAKDWKTANDITFCLFFETVPEDIRNHGWVHYQDSHKIKLVNYSHCRDVLYNVSTLLPYFKKCSKNLSNWY